MKQKRTIFKKDNKEKNRKKLEGLVHRTNREILKISSFFPFDLFPDVLTIYPDRVNIIFKEFFFSKQIITTLVEDIKDVVVENSIVFATIKITIDDYEPNPAIIRFLKKGEAVKARRIIQGLTALDKAGIDILQVKGEIENFVEKIGKTEQETGAF